MEFRGFPKQELNILWPLRYCISVFVQLWSCQCHVLIFYRILRKIKPILQIRLKIEDAQTSSFWFCLFSSGLAWFVFKQILHLTFYNPWILNMGVFIQNCHYQSIKAIIGIGRAIKMSTLSLWLMQDFVFLKKSVNVYYYRVYKESQYSYKILWCLKSCLSSDVQLNTCTGIKHQNQSIYHDSCFSVHNIPCALHIDILWIRNWSSVIYLFYNWITRFLLYGHFIPMYT